jgi:hypothetical protein
MHLRPWVVLEVCLEALKFVTPAAQIALWDEVFRLSGLQHVTPKHETVATAVFLYYLKHSETSNNGKEALNASFCISGLVKFSYRDARPAIAQFTNNANKYLAETANQALLSLDAPPRSSR